MKSMKFLVVIAIANLVTATSLDAQLIKNSYRTGDSDPEAPNFSFSTSVGMSLSGPVYKSEFKMVDELGLEYDVMSLLKNEAVRDDIELTEDQYAAMTKVKNTLNANVAEFIQSMTSEKMESVKSQIIATEAQLAAMLKPEQFQRLQQLKNQMGINRFGLASYLNTKSMLTGMGLSPDAAEQFKSKTEELKEELKSKMAEANREANVKLLERVSKRQRDKVKNLLGEDNYEKFLASKLFSDSKPKLRKLNRNQVSMLYALQSPKVRKELEIVDDQYNDIRELKSEYDHRLSDASEELFGQFTDGTPVTERAKKLKELSDESHLEFESELRRVLLDFQSKRLDQIVAELETTRMGTVGSLCYGLLSKKLSIKEDEIESLFETGMELEKVRIEQASKLKKDFDQQILALLPPAQEKRMANLLGETASFKLR